MHGEIWLDERYDIRHQAASAAGGVFWQQALIKTAATHLKLTPTQIFCLLQYLHLPAWKQAQDVQSWHIDRTALWPIKSIVTLTPSVCCPFVFQQQFH